MPLSSIVCQVSPLSIVFLPSPTFVLFHFSYLLLLLFSYDYFPFNYLDFLFLIFGWVGCCLIDIEMLFSVQTNEPKPNRDEISGAVRLSFCSCSEPDWLSSGSAWVETSQTRPVPFPQIILHLLLINFILILEVFCLVTILINYDIIE